MTWRAVGRGLAVLNLVGLFGLAAWFRLSSLEAMPEHTGDEAIYGVECLRVLAGRPFTIWTPTGHLLDPFYFALELPLVAWAEPSLWVLRLPAALSSLVAVAVAYFSLKGVLGRATALGASALLACLPGAIITARIGCEISQIPVIGLMALAFALRGRGLALLATVLVGLVVHPTTVFLVPVVLAVYLGATLPKAGGRRARLLRLVPALAAASAIVLGYGMNQLWSSTARAYRSFHKAEADYPGWLLSPARFLSGAAFYRFKPILDADAPVSLAALRLHDAAAWALAIGALAFGLRRLVRDRKWEQLALVVGLAAALAGFLVVARPDPLWSRSWRYGAFLMAPAAVALACLLRLDEPGRGRRLVAFGVCWAMLLGVKVQYFDFFAAAGRESVWTFRADTKDPQRQALAVIVRDLARSGSARGRIIGGDHWSHKPLEFLASNRRGVEVTRFDQIGPDPADRPRLLREAMGQGAYAVELAGKPLETVLDQVAPADALRRWDVAGTRGDRYLTVYRLKRPDDAPPVARAEGAGVSR